MRSLVPLALVLSLLSASKATAEDWLFFDLGEVIVTGTPQDGYRYVAGVVDALEAYRAAGYKLGLITNIPEVFGARCDEKLATLRTFLDERLHEPAPFDWTRFDIVVLPPFDRYRKPEPYVFMRALERSCGGRALFAGETPAEVDVADRLGFATWNGDAEATPYPPLALVPALLDDGFRFEAPAQCDFAELVRATLLPTDVERGVEGCVEETR